MEPVLASKLKTLRRSRDTKIGPTGTDCNRAANQIPGLSETGYR